MEQAKCTVASLPPNYADGLRINVLALILKEFRDSLRDTHENLRDLSNFKTIETPKCFSPHKGGNQFLNRLGPKCSLLTNVPELNGCTITPLRHADGDTLWDIELNGDVVDKFGSFFATTEQQG